MDIGEVKARVRKAAETFGLPMVEREWVCNSRLAQELGAWAETKGKDGEFHKAVFWAYFVDGIDISKVSGLIDVARSVGLPEGESRKVLEGRVFRDVIDFDWAYCRKMGVTEVPIAVIGKHAMIGAQPYEVFEHLMMAGNVERRQSLGK